MSGFINKLFEDKKIRFLFVGALNTIFGYAVYAFFIYLRMHYFLAQLLSSILAIAHSYLWNKYFTFRSPGISASEIMRFVSVYAVSYLMNMGILYVSIEYFKWNAYFAGFICLFVTAVVSYVGHKSISFRNPPKSA
jgi:putative flippase GtrA